MNKIIYYCGNESDQNDNLPFKIIKVLRKKFPELIFKHFDPTETENLSGNPVIIDTVLGIDKITVFGNLKNFELSPANSVHDYDLPLDLGLLLKLKKIKGFTIIGIPENYDINRAVKEISVILGTGPYRL